MGLNLPIGKENTMMNKPQQTKPLHEQVAERVIAALKEGTAPWQKPWKSEGAALILPYNFQSGKRYKGINALSLLTSGREDPRWMTYKQAQESGYQVRKGERSTLIQFIKKSEDRIVRDDSGHVVLDATGNPRKASADLPRAIISNAYVFNADQIEGIPELTRTGTDLSWNPIERADQLVKASGARISHIRGDRAFYSPVHDHITLPPKKHFEDAPRYYATLLHELGHWTGHPERLNRNLEGGFGNLNYAREELKAEIASLIIGQEIGIGHDPGQHYAYVDHWIEILEKNPFEIFTASMDAERIFNYLLMLEQRLEIKQEPGTSPELVHPAAKRTGLLTAGDKIPYKDTQYEVLGHLKKGRLKMVEEQSDLHFILSPEDKLYGNLMRVKEQMHNRQNPDRSSGVDDILSNKTQNRNINR